MGEQSTNKNFYYMLTFDSKHSHPVQVYIKVDTFVPMRYNHKDSDVRKVIYQVPKDKHDHFKSMLNELINVQGRNIKVSKPKEAFCDNCGVQYEYRKNNRIGEKTCAECGNNNFIYN